MQLQNLTAHIESLLKTTIFPSLAQTDALPSQPLVPLNPNRVYKVTRYLLICLYENLTGPLIPSVLQYVRDKLSSKRRTISAKKNVKYGPKERNRLDIYYPDRGSTKDNSRAGFPVIILISTSWNSGNRATCIPVAENLISQRYVVVVPDITLYPEGKISEMVADVQQCMFWTSARIRQYRGDPSQIYLMGHAAGAVLSALTVIHHACATLRLLPPNNTRLHLPVWNETAKKGLEHVHAMPRVMGNTAESLRQCSPAHLIHNVLMSTQKYEKFRKLLPEKTVLIHGANDTFNPSITARNFYYLLNSMGVSVQFKIYKDIKHISPRIDLIAPSKKLCTLLLDDIRECCQMSDDPIVKKKSWDEREE
ncbi:6061_t:CDS:2 [Acaulospora colombiana]|uniref:6061_t:CDS:1 n=1 Tax=Acaulospora colombiana TaxID=27376 RepID=A0ACA9KKB2_9GLOM|nr:6061_t:CDS:2 [Acaulospora colombiana]